jgi:hypothetical protein
MLELVRLIARTMSPLYSCLRGFVNPFFDAGPTMLLMVALSWSRHGLGDIMPGIPVG